MSHALSDLILLHPLIFAAVFGIIPALIWLWFWLKEDIHPEPTKLLIFTFLAGSLAVFAALPLQKLCEALTSNVNILFVLWALIEELLIFGAAWVGGLHTTSDDEPIDPLIYMIVAALGFMAMENTLFLVDPLISGNLANTFITGGLRFIGAGLLHIMSSSTIGIFLSIGFGKGKKKLMQYGTIGVILAVALHALFNILIMNDAGGNVLMVFGWVWAGIVALLLAFEKIKTLPATI